jgi:hypothetical protein
MDIHGFFKSGGQVDVAGLASWLDGLAPDVRKEAVRSLRRTEQAALFEAAKGFRPLALQDFVPGEAPLQPVIHFGKNSLPAFSHFEKRFCWNPERTELWGYNAQDPKWLEAVITPGYFVARAHGEGEVVIDYRAEAPGRSEGWPEILPNGARMGRFVYFQMLDVMRGVSRHVTIGRASRHGKEMPAWFALCREGH